MNTNGLVSVIIPVYNRETYLVEAVQSVLDQTYKKYETIIINDGSTDNTPQVADELANKYDSVKVIHKQNAGVGLARETGRLAATGEFIQYLDSDDRLLPRKFELQVQALNNNHNCDIAYGKTRLIDSFGEVLDGKAYKLSGQKIDYLFPALLVDRWWNTHTPLYRKSLCDKLGPWKDMRMSEDWEYDARAGEFNVQLSYIPEFVSEHRHHDSDERLTGKGFSKESISDITLCFSALLKSFNKTNLPFPKKEFKSYTNNCFLMARRACFLHQKQETKQLLKLCLKTNNYLNFKLLFFNIFFIVFGIKITGKLLGEKL